MARGADGRMNCECRLTDGDNPSCPVHSGLPRCACHVPSGQIDPCCPVHGMLYSRALPVAPKVEDNWADLSTYACRTCRFYVRKNLALGRCRRHAPTMGGFPVVYPSDWCGDHKLKSE